MKANELRIGNYVNYEQTTHIITSINDSYCNSIWVEDTKSIYTHSLQHIKPIPLTEECLLKFGFEENKNYNNFVFNYYSIKYKEWEDDCGFTSMEWVFNSDESDANCYTLCFIKYVHQLQNLYFALTGEELEVKE